MACTKGLILRQWINSFRGDASEKSSRISVAGYIDRRRIYLVKSAVCIKSRSEKVNCNHLFEAMSTAQSCLARADELCHSAMLLGVGL
jgi:hypothetical protein